MLSHIRPLPTYGVSKNVFSRDMVKLLYFATLNIYHKLSKNFSKIYKVLKNFLFFNLNFFCRLFKFFWNIIPYHKEMIKSARERLCQQYFGSIFLDRLFHNSINFINIGSWFIDESKWHSVVCVDIELQWWLDKYFWIDFGNYQFLNMMGNNYEVVKIGQLQSKGKSK